MEIRGRDIAYPGGGDFFGVDGMTEGNARENRDLVARVQAIDVERGICFRVSGGLCCGERLRKLDPSLLHLRENVIAGPVQDSVNCLDFVPGQRFRNSSDYRYAAGYAGLNADG